MPQTPTRALLALGANFSLLLGCLALLILAGPSQRAAADLPPSGRCVASGDKTAAAEVAAGQSAWVQAWLNIACGPVTAPLHVALVLDGSEAMSGTLKNDIHAQAAAIVRGMQLPANPETRLAVVEFNDRARRLADLTNDQAALLQAVEKSGARGKPAMERGLAEAVALLEAGRRLVSTPAALTEAIVLVSNGRNEKGCSAAVDAAQAAKSGRILVLTSCVSAGCELDCLRQVATAPRYAYPKDEAGQAALMDTLRRGQRQTAVSVVDLVIRDELRLAYLADSGTPVPDWVSADRKELRWRATAIPSAGLTISFQVETGPTDVGEQPVSVDARALYTNSIGWSGEFVFPVPVIRVLPPSASATPTESPPASATPEPTSAPGPTATPTATGSAGGRLFLPWLGREFWVGNTAGRSAGAAGLLSFRGPDKEGR